jgi:hypothetical protein
MLDTVTGFDVGMKLARTRLFNKVGGKEKPLCLACGELATNQLPSCSKHKCVQTVRPVARWSTRVAAIATPAALRRSVH